MKKTGAKDRAIRAGVQQERNFQPLTVGKTNSSGNYGPDYAIFAVKPRAVNSHRCGSVSRAGCSAREAFRLEIFRGRGARLLREYLRRITLRRQRPRNVRDDACTLQAARRFR